VGFALVLVLAGALASPALAEVSDLEGLTAFVAEKAKEAGAWSADSETKVSMMGMETVIKGSLLVKGECSVMNTNMEMMGQKMTMRQVVGEDGVLWTENQVMGQTMVIKVPVDEREKTAGPGRAGNPVDPSMAAGDMLEKMSEVFDLSFEGTEELSDGKAYRVKGTLKEGGMEKLDTSGMMEQMGLTMDAISMWFSAEDGLTRKMVMMDSEGTPFITQAFSNINLDPEVAADAFNYTPPEGVQVIDASQMQGMPGAAAGAPPAPAP